MVICSGQGPSVDHARAYSVRSCKSAATDFLRSDIAVRGVTVESEHGVSVHQEVQENASFKGLSCNPLRDQVRAISDGLYEVWLKCAFDLSKVEQTKGVVDEGGAQSDKSPQRMPKSDREGLVRQRELQFDRSQPISAGASSWVMDIVSIPPCDSLVVKGKKARPVKCSPVGVTSLTIESGDEEVIVRAEGYLSKSIKIIAAGSRHETFQVILDPAN
ncbi:MAG: hypothetical protein RIQ81_347 [Pseudomonadota bacterium]